MPSFGSTSRERLETCHYDIQRIMNKAIELYDFSVIEGIRTAEKQNEYFRDNKSQLDGYEKLSWHQDRFGDGLSRAIDIVPYFDGKQQWENEAGYRKLAKVIFNVTQELLFKQEIGHYIEWGGNWSTFVDKPHWQIKQLDL